MISRSLFLALNFLAGAVVAAEPELEERLVFQTNSAWSPRINLNADVAIAYGIDRGLPDRVASWRAHGFRVHAMTGVSWGMYADYLDGRFDGRVHDDQGQTDRNGQRIMHGIGHGVYYLCPTDDYARYLCAGVQRALDAGVEAIHLEEPEFWARAGYSPAFKREWKEFYHEDWQPPHESVDAQYRASKLKYVLFQRALAQIFRYVQDYNRKHGRAVRCYVPSHSLLNYAHWHIVSPESSLLNVGCDGFIAQVWTGTSRTPNVYEGEAKERTFETAFLEYGAMQNLVRASGKRVWYLNDPVEDNPNRSWADYRRNWENTLVASLLQSEVWRYEIMPWPERVFGGRYPADDAALKMPVAERPLVSISADYETELQTVIRALGQMKQPEASVRWEKCGMQGVGVLVSDTMMFQRADPSPSDASLGSFYGLAMPLLKRGVPVQPVQIEFADRPKSLAPYRVLLLTYEGQKPPSPALHEALVTWVKAGGALVVVDDDRDPYLKVREWWNQDGRNYTSPRQHLFEQLGLPRDAVGTFAVGKGIVVRADVSPAALTYQKNGSRVLCDLVRGAAERAGIHWSESPTLILRRGPMVVVADVADEQSANAARRIAGRFINLFDSELHVQNGFDVRPGARALLVDLDIAAAAKPAIVAASCRTTAISRRSDRLTFTCDGIANTLAHIVIEMDSPPKSATVDGEPIADRSFVGGILRMHFGNTSGPRRVEIVP